MCKIVKGLKKVLAVLLCLSFFPAVAAAEPVQAEEMTGGALAAYINRCYNSIQPLSSLIPTPKVIARAYLVGEDDEAAASWLRDPATGAAVAHELYAVDPNTEIQGCRYNSKYFPQNNMEYVRDIQEKYGQSFNYTGRIYNMPAGAQYIEREGCMFAVVACDEDWVTVWSPGYQAWNVYYASYGIAWAGGCVDTYTNDAYMETHPAGFYKIQRNKVWMDFSLKENHPYNSEAEIPKAGSGVVTKLANLLPVPDEGEKTYTAVYALPVNTEVNVVSTELVPSNTPGSTIKYYKVSFNGSEKVQNNAVGYMQYQVPGVYYLDSRYLNFTKEGTKTPKGAELGVIANTAKNSSVYVYRSKDTNSECIGILSLDAEIEMFPSESDASWTTVFFNGQKAYVETKYIKKGTYKVKDISNLRAVNVVKDEIKMGWDPGENNVEYYCRILSLKGKVLWSDKHCKKNSFVIKRKYIEKNNMLHIKVQAKDKNGKKGKTLFYNVYLPYEAVKPDKKRMVIGKNKITSIKYSSLGESLQYSTNKKFKKAVTVEKYSKKEKKYKPITAIKKLKKNKTYYIRRRQKGKVETDAGTKWVSGKWSKSIKIRTKK